MVSKDRDMCLDPVTDRSGVNRGQSVEAIELLMCRPPSTRMVSPVE